MGEDQNYWMDRAKAELSIGDFAELLCSDKLGPQLGKVGIKFIRSMLLGISRSRSVNLTDISQALDEKISLHATHKRLCRNLEDLELSANLADRLLRLGAEKVGPDTRLIIHLYELNKKYARKMEYLSTRDELDGAGFKVCEILASEPESDTYIPLTVNVWSNQVPGFISDADEIRKTVMRVQAAMGNRGVFYIDDHSLDFELFRPIMKDSWLDYVFPLQNEELELVHKNDCYSVSGLLEQVETRYGKILYKLVPEGMVGEAETDLDLFVHVGAAAIKLQLSNRPLSFIALKYSSSLGENSTPIITTKVNLRSRKALMGLVESFLGIQDIVELHQSLRSGFSPENFRVLTYNRLQLLMTLLEAVIYYEVSVSGKVLIRDHRFAAKPHDGEIDRTYLLPKHVERG